MRLKQAFGNVGTITDELHGASYETLFPMTLRGQHSVRIPAIMSASSGIVNDDSEDTERSSERSDN